MNNATKQICIYALFDAAATRAVPKGYGPLAERLAAWQHAVSARAADAVAEIQSLPGGEPAENLEPSMGWEAAYAAKGESQRRYVAALERRRQAMEIFTIPLWEPAAPDGTEYAATVAADNSGEIAAFEAAVERYVRSARDFARRTN
jgi:hypothetical protein